jgi:hypothetical protein
MWLSWFVYGASIIIFTVSAETTPHVHQASGYGDLASNKSIWFVFLFGISLCNSYHRPTNRFWFFAARNNPDEAPLITWFNGGVRDSVC